VITFDMVIRCPACNRPELVAPEGLAVTSEVEVTISYRCTGCGHRWSLRWQRDSNGKMVAADPEIDRAQGA